MNNNRFINWFNPLIGKTFGKKQLEPPIVSEQEQILLNERDKQTQEFYRKHGHLLNNASYEERLKRFDNWPK